jgi:hypothetical protein
VFARAINSSDVMETVSVPAKPVAALFFCPSRLWLSTSCEKHLSVRADQREQAGRLVLPVHHTPCQLKIITNLF